MKRDYTGCNPQVIGDEKDAEIDRLWKQLRDLSDRYAKLIDKLEDTIDKLESTAASRRVKP